MDIITISLEEVEIHGRHGVMPQENRVGNTFRVSVSVDIPVDFDPSADNPDSTISYADIYDIVKEEMAVTSKLLETVAWRIADRLRRRWPVIIKGFVAIAKCPPPISGIIGNASVKYFFEKN